MDLAVIMETVCFLWGRNFPYKYVDEYQGSNFKRIVFHVTCLSRVCHTVTPVLQSWAAQRRTSDQSGHAVVQLVEALRYKPEGRGFDVRWCHNPPGCILALASTQPLTEMSTVNISWGWRWPVHSTYNRTTFICRLSRKLGAPTSWYRLGLKRLEQGFLYFSYTVHVF
jgi:hypothetical protein